MMFTCLHLSHIVLCARPYANSFPLMSLYDLKNYKHIYTYSYFTDEDTGTERLSHLPKITQLS